MEIILSIMALCISLLAMWMGSASLRKSDGSVSTFILSARKELGSAKAEIDITVANMGKRVDALDQLVSGIQGEVGKSNSSVATMQSEIRALRDDLEALDGSIPKQYRHPTSRTGQQQVTQ